MPKILSIDTSGQTACAAVTDENYTLAEMNIHSGGKLTHSEMLLPMIDRLLDAAGLTLDACDCIAAASGPGSFTGLRIGAATALGLAHGAGKRIVPVPSLDALVCNVCADGYALPMMDARRGQVYTALYLAEGGGFRRVGGPLACTLSEALALRAAEGSPDCAVTLIGDGALAYRPEIMRLAKATGCSVRFAPPNACLQRGASVGLCALRMLAEGFEPVETFELEYVRKPQAERVRDARRAAEEAAG